MLSLSAKCKPKFGKIRKNLLSKQSFYMGRNIISYDCNPYIIQYVINKYGINYKNHYLYPLFIKIHYLILFNHLNSYILIQYNI
jgi:hypothetical protein